MKDPGQPDPTPTQGVKSIGRVVTATFTRPNNTTAYASNDAMSDAADNTATSMTFSSVARVAGGHNWLMGGQLVTTNAANTALAAELYLFDADPTALEDNAAFDPSDAEANTMVLALKFENSNIKTLGNNQVIPATFPNGSNPVLLKCAAGATDLYGYLRATAAYTPAALESFQVKLFVMD